MTYTYATTPYKQEGEAPCKKHGGKYDYTWDHCELCYLEERNRVIGWKKGE